MPTSATFVDFALDLLALAGPVQARRMFGGHGLYLGGAMFGLLDDDELFLKTDAETAPRFVAAGCRPWVYTRRDGTPERTSYYRPPDEAHEDAEAMLPWARLAVDAALRARAAKEAKARAAAARRAAKVRAGASRPAKERGRVAPARKGSSARRRPARAPR